MNMLFDELRNDSCIKMTFGLSDAAYWRSSVCFASVQRPLAFHEVIDVFKGYIVA